MNAAELKKILMPLNELDEIYRDIAERFPLAYDCIYASYDDFSARCAQLYPASSLPEGARRYMGPTLSEQECFHAVNYDNITVYHPRFLPPHRETLDFIKIVYMISGSATFYTGAEKRDIKEGDFVIVPPGTDHSLYCGAVDSLAVNIVLKMSNFSSSMASLLSEDNTISDFFWRIVYGRSDTSVLLCRGCNDSRLADLVAEMWATSSETSGTRVNNLFLKSDTLLFFAIVMKYHANNISVIGTDGKVGNNFSVIVRYIYENYRDVSLASVAARFNFSTGYMSSYIHHQTGMTFRELVLSFRIEQAANMLRNSACTVEQISEAVGYIDAGRFYRNFKEIYGTTPDRYRRISKNIF